MPRETEALTYDRETDRWTLGDWSLHCGDGLEVKIGGHWLPVRVEHSDRHGWVFHADDDAVRILPSRSLPARPDAHDARW